MRFASVAEIKDRLSQYLGEARKKKEPIVVTHHGKPYALIQPISERDLEGLGWEKLAADRLRQAWEGEDDALYEDLCEGRWSWSTCRSPITLESSHGRRSSSASSRSTRAFPT